MLAPKRTPIGSTHLSLSVSSFVQPHTGGQLIQRSLLPSQNGLQLGSSEQFIVVVDGGGERSERNTLGTEPCIVHMPEDPT